MKVSHEKKFIRKVRLARKAGLKDGQYIDNLKNENELDSLEKRIQKVQKIYYRKKQNPLNMIYFIMYDIENNKVRNQIAKYLLNKGCTRIQKSIYLNESERKTYREIHEALKEVQECYDNCDSILIVPVSVDFLQSMKIIGTDINLDMILDNKNTLFF